MLITRANYKMTVGNFEMDFGDGEIRFEQTQLYAGGYAQMANAVLG